MPNGGSDCCGTCWFNARNQGERGFRNADHRIAPYCVIRRLPIGRPFYTYCANHPHRRASRDRISMGPVYGGDDSNNRWVRKPSPDNDLVRQHLLDLLKEIPEWRGQEYPIGYYCEEVVVWQLGEFKEKRARQGLRHLITLDETAIRRSSLEKDRRRLAELADEALRKIEATTCSEAPGP